MTRNIKSAKKAFTLLELSLVVLIVSILISGGLSVSVTAINNSKMRITKERINLIYRAMGNYLLINKKLPCPGALTEAKSSSTTYGSEGFCDTISKTGIYVSSNAPLLNYGSVPVTALGLPKDMAEDGFGGKLVYIVDRTFAAETGYAHDKYGSITIMENQGGADQTVIPTSSISLGNDKAVLVIMSYGQNQFGAFPADSNAINSNSTDTKEIENALGSIASPDFDYSFFSESKNSDSFDDYVFYKTRNNIMIDFNALSLIKCTSTSDNSDDVANCESGTCTWPDAYYGQIAVSTSPCASTHLTTVAYPTKRCLAYGVWQPGAINPCTN